MKSSSRHTIKYALSKFLVSFQLKDGNVFMCVIFENFEFHVSSTNDVVSFEQLGSDEDTWARLFKTNHVVS